MGGASSSEVQTPLKDWLRLARNPAIVRRALGYAVVVGAILIAINHGDAILRGDLSVERALKMGLTMVVPYMVSTLSSVSALRSTEGGGSG
jgi:hypothetical protein